MEEETQREFIGKSGKIVTLNDFCLFGTIIDINNEGVFFKTKQRTSFISFAEIRRFVEGVVYD